MEGSERVLGTDHPDTLICVSNLALLLHDQGRLAEAEPLCRWVWKVCVREGSGGMTYVAGVGGVGWVVDVMCGARGCGVRGRLAKAQPLCRCVQGEVWKACASDCRLTACCKPPVLDVICPAEAVWSCLNL